MHQLQLGLVKFTVERDFPKFLHHKDEGTLKGLRVNVRRLGYFFLTGRWLDQP